MLLVLPQSLRGQFMLGLAMLSLLTVAIGAAALYALRSSSQATGQLAQERLQHMHEAQEIVRRTQQIELDAERLLSTPSARSLQWTYAAIVEQTAQVDRMVGELAQVSEDAGALDLYQASELLRNSAHVVAQLRRNALEAGAPPAAQPDPLMRFRDELARQAETLADLARGQSARYDQSYRGALQELLDRSQRDQRWILALLACSLLFTWLVAGLFLGRHLLGRLQQVSRHLRLGRADAAALDRLAHGSDEIAEMARSLEQFLADRRQLEQRTAELGRAKEELTEQGHILEMIATCRPLPEVLGRLVEYAEAQLDGITGSILMLDADGLHLRHGAAPRLPEPYNRAVDGVRVGPRAGSCGTAIHRRDTVIVSDIESDPLWDDFRELARSNGLRSCWSTPIISHGGAVLGTFAMYSGAVHTPGADELRCVDLAAHIAGIAIESQRAERRIRHMAHHDELTGLPNRALLHDRMTQALARARHADRPLALLFLDLDGFKHINDSLGHAIGDRLLVAVAQRLQGLVRDGDTVARLGGDEFVVMLVDMQRAEHAASVAEHIVRDLAQPFHADEHTLHVTASVGIATYPADGDSVVSLLKHADAAMYRAKAQGRNGYQCYTSEMGQQARQRVELTSALCLALEREEFELHYQPQIEASTGHLVAVEALIRWRQPELGMVGPDRFIALAEETGLIVPIGEWVLRTACRQLQHWRQAGHAGLLMAVNVSARQLDTGDLPQRVRRTLGECGLPASSLEIELTESALIHSADAVSVTLQDLSAQGVMLALDDFGTGASSLSHLRRFPIDTIKIDRSFTRDIQRSDEATSIIRAIVAMARSLRIATVAEGVETDEQLRFLSTLGCDRIQGYYFSRPVPAEQIGAMLETRSRRAEPAAA